MVGALESKPSALFRHPLGELAGLSLVDFDKLLEAATVAFNAAEYAVSAKLFGALEVLQPQNPAHAVRHAAAHAANGNPAEALSALRRFFSRTTVLSPGLHAVALELLSALSDPKTAKTAHRAAQHLRKGAR